MSTRKTVGLLVLFLIVTLPAIEDGSIAPKSHATSGPAAPTFHAWTEAFSGGVWARLNHVPLNGTILDSAQAQTRFGSIASSPASSPDPPSPFTNNFRVTGNSSLFPFEDEPSITVRNQTGQILIVVGANSLSTGQMVSYYSTDQGAHWSTPSFLPFSKANDSFASDPALAVDRGGTFYYSFLSLAASSATGIVTNDDLVVATSADGSHWTDHIAVPRKTFAPPSTTVAEVYDKEYLAVGPNKNNLASDAIYVTYTDFTEVCPTLTTNCNIDVTIMQVHSTDAGATWSSPVAVSPTVSSPTSATTPHIVQGSMPAVTQTGALAGDVYVAYFDTGPSGFLNTTASIMVARSTNAGASFASPILAATIAQQLTFSSQSGFRWWSSMFPSMDVAQDGTVYVAYGARQAKYSTDPADVFLVASTNQGASWSLPIMINDQSSQNGHFFAWLKASSDNVVHIIWGDQRLDPVGLGYDIFYATATNHGTTIGANVRVTDVSTDPLQTIGFIGDYFNLAVSGNQTYPVWTDGRRAVRPLGREILVGETDLYTARLGPRDTPSITIQGNALAGYQGPVTIAGTGLPREAYFTARIGGVPAISQANLIRFFFSTRSGTLSDMIVPVSNYYGSYTAQLTEWVSGDAVASTTLYEVDTRSLQVSVNGPATALPGDTVKWTIQLVAPSGPGSVESLTSSFFVNKAQLTLPNGSVRDLTSSLNSETGGAFTVSTTLPTDLTAGSYVLYVNASEIGALVQSNGVQTATLTLTSQPQSASNLAATEQTYILIVGLIAAVGVALQVIQLARRRPGTPYASPPALPTST